MKTAEAIKESLEPCRNTDGCDQCIMAYSCKVESDALEYIKRLECELAATKAFMRYLAKDVPRPCQYCKHDVKGGCTQECYGQGLEHFAFEWKGLPDNVF